MSKQLLSKLKTSYFSIKIQLKFTNVPTNPKVTLDNFSINKSDLHNRNEKYNFRKKKETYCKLIFHRFRLCFIVFGF